MAAKEEEKEMEVGKDLAAGKEEVMGEEKEEGEVKEVKEEEKELSTCFRLYRTNSQDRTVGARVFRLKRSRTGKHVRLRVVAAFQSTRNVLVERRSGMKHISI